MTLVRALALATALALPLAAPADDRFELGGTVTQDTLLEGDFFGVGGDVHVRAPVKGDLTAFGGHVRIGAPVAQDVLIAGGTVSIEAAVGGDVVVAGGNAQVTGSGAVAGDLSVAAGEVLVLGPVKGSVHAGAGSVLIDAEVGGDVEVGTGRLELGPNARISGTLRYRGPREVIRHPDAQVANEKRTGEGRQARPDEHREPRTVHHVRHEGGGWAWTVGIIVLAALLAAIFPAAYRRLGAQARAHPGLMFLFGFLALVAVPVAALILAITLIGLPIAIVLLLLYFVLLVVGYAGVGVLVGDAALERLRSDRASAQAWRIGAAMLAMLAIALLARVPFVGGLVFFVVLLAGLGTLMLAFKPRDPA